MDTADTALPDFDAAPKQLSTLQVRERMRVLVVNPQERRLLDDLRVPPYRQWIAAVTRLAPSQVEVVDVADGAALPDTIEAHGIIGGGSVHAAFEDLPWIRAVKEFYRRAATRGVPQLHICWSHQAMVIANGGMVVRGDNGRRFGIEELRLTPAGRRDPLFTGLPDTFELFTSHTDVATVLGDDGQADPVELAYSGHYRNEAVAFGARVRTLQPHPEVSADLLMPLARVRRETLVREGSLGPSKADFDAFLTGLRAKDERILRHNRQIFSNWITHFAGAHFLRRPSALPN
ncbi:MAG: type 1 glutamine amidotransferase [Thermoactinospora sp.]|nr:type 1 glutamine amidotransferase [Thermoactinospora sp.]